MKNLDLKQCHCNTNKIKRLLFSFDSIFFQLPVFFQIFFSGPASMFMYLDKVYSRAMNTVSAPKTGG